MVLIGILEMENDSEWRSSSFSQTKTNPTQVLFLSDFININKKLKVDPYPMPNINEMFLQF